MLWFYTERSGLPGFNTTCQKNPENNKKSTEKVLFKPIHRRTNMCHKPMFGVSKDIYFVQKKRISYSFEHFSKSEKPVAKNTSKPLNQQNHKKCQKVKKILSV